jgi:thiosulfate/3-mercaptopyruvate sulfurtransferase
MARNGYASTVLVSTQWVAEHISDPRVVIAEVDENPDLYDAGHIPGAVKLHWRDDLQDPVERDLVSKAEFERLLCERGIGIDTSLVLYGDKHNWFAAYAYWYVKIYGHADVRIMDGGRQKWIDEGRALTAITHEPIRVSYRTRDRDESIRAYRDQVLYWMGTPGHALVDVRSPGEFAGELAAPPGYEREGAQRATSRPRRRSPGLRRSATMAPSGRRTS